MANNINVPKENPIDMSENYSDVKLNVTDTFNRINNRLDNMVVLYASGNNNNGKPKPKPKPKKPAQQQKPKKDYKKAEEAGWQILEIVIDRFIGRFFGPFIIIPTDGSCGLPAQA